MRSICSLILAGVALGLSVLGLFLPGNHGFSCAIATQELKDQAAAGGAPVRLIQCNKITKEPWGWQAHMTILLQGDKMAHLFDFNFIKFPYTPQSYQEIGG